MSKIKILIVEDEFIIAMQISDLMDELGYEVVNTSSNYDDAVESLKTQNPDIALLDIQLKGEKTGIDVAEYIKNNYHIPFIFLTSNSDSRTLGKAKLLNPNAYLVKPFNSKDLYTSIELAIHNFQSTKKDESKSEFNNSIIKDAFFVKSHNSILKVNFDEIVFAKSEHVYVELHTTDEKIHLIRSTMDELTKNLADNFIRVHRSYVININFLESFNTNFAEMKRSKIPISKNYRNRLIALLKIQ